VASGRSQAVSSAGGEAAPVLRHWPKDRIETATAKRLPGFFSSYAERCRQPPYAARGMILKERMQTSRMWRSCSTDIVLPDIVNVFAI
jgi:hypothetical protein